MPQALLSRPGQNVVLARSDDRARAAGAMGAVAFIGVLGALFAWWDPNFFLDTFGIRKFYRLMIGVSVVIWSLATLAWLAVLLIRSSIGRPFAWSGWQHWFSVSLIFVLVWAAFWNSFKYSGWVLDNLYIIKYDPRHRATTWEDGTAAGLNPGVKQIFMQDYWWPKGISGLFRPITTFTYWLNFTAFENGEDTTYYHVVNFFLHWANASLVYVLAWKLTGRWVLALLAGAIFGVHPITVESVTNIIGRADQLAALVVLLGLLTWMRADTRSGWWKLPWLSGLMLLTAFGVFAKESALAIGLVVVAYDLVYRWNPRVARFFTIALVLLVVTLFAGFSFADFKPVEAMWPWLKILCAVALALGAVGSHFIFAFLPPEDRRGPLVLSAGLALLASVFHPLAGAAAVLVGAVIELFVARWIWEGSAQLWKLRWTALLYTTAFVVCLGLPYAVGELFARLGWTQTLGAGELYLRASVAAGAAVLAYVYLCRSDRQSRVIGLLLAVAAAVISSLYIKWFGLVATFTIGLIELIRHALAPASLAASEAWRSLRQRFVVGYYLLLPPALAMYFVRSWVFANSTPPETPFLDNPLRGDPFEGMAFIVQRMTAIKVIGKLTYLLFWPLHLSSDYSWNEIPLFSARVWEIENLKAIAALLFVIGTFVAAAYHYKRDKALCFYILFFYAALLPTSNLITVIGSIMAERFMYLPLIGFSSAMVIVAAKLLAAALQTVEPGLPVPAATPSPPARNVIRGSVVAAISTLVIGLFVARTYVRNFNWYSDETLWRAAIKVSPQSFRCYQSLGFALFENLPPRLDYRPIPPTTLAKIDEIIATAEGGLPIVKDLPDDWNSSRLFLHLGMYYQIMGDVLSHRQPDGEIVATDAARPWFEKSIAILEHGSRIDRAFNRVNYRKQLERGDKPGQITDVGLTPIYATLAQSYYKLGMYHEAVNALRYQIHLEPAADPEPYFRLGLAYRRMQRYDESAAALIEALLIDQNRMIIWAALADLYAQFGQQTANVIGFDAASGKPRLNFEHPVIREHVRDAYRDIIRTLRRAKRTDYAEMMRKFAVEQYRFPRSLFDLIFAEPLPEVTPHGPVWPDAKPPG